VVNKLSDIIAQARAMFVNFSDILKKEVMDTDGKAIGRVWDISVRLGEVYPKSEDLVIAKGLFDRSYASVAWSCILSMEDDIILNLKTEAVKFDKAPKDYEFLLKRDILDQQVVDTFNHKVRRVNDIHLLKVDHELVIAHVDIGMRGLVRRLGWETAVDVIMKGFAKDSDYMKKDDLVSWKYVQPISVNPASMTMKLAFSEKQLLSIPPADLGDIIFDITPAQRMVIFRTLDPKTKARVFENLELEEQKIILKDLDKKEAAQLVTNMSSDEATDLLEKLPQNTVKNLLTLVESSRAKKLSTLLGYSSDSAGGLMTTELVSMNEAMTAGEAIEYIKTKTKDVETVPYIYIVDEKNHLKGVTTIRRLLFADPKEAISKIAFSKLIYVYLNNSVKELAYLMDRYKISAIPVIDENKILHGIVTVDDILSQVISIAWRKRPNTSKGL
jgi:CBS domain-containing protein/sporulation protein YlmC with PRC-barrel domain